MKKDKRKKNKKKYLPLTCEKYSIAELSKDWDLEAVGLFASCEAACGTHYTHPF